eukprot:363500-Chlamydomonas_euryale.AAC.13
MAPRGAALLVACAVVDAAMDAAGGARRRARGQSAWAAQSRRARTDGHVPSWRLRAVCRQACATGRLSCATCSGCHLRDATQHRPKPTTTHLSGHEGCKICVFASRAACKTRAHLVCSNHVLHARRAHILRAHLAHTSTHAGAYAPASPAMHARSGALSSAGPSPVCVPLLHPPFHALP